MHTAEPPSLTRAHHDRASVTALRPLAREDCPGALRPLWDLSWNFWWTWDQPTRELFASIDPAIWETTRHNPVRTLALVTPERLHELAGDDSFLERVADASERFKAHLDAPPSSEWTAATGMKVAYFCAEYGLAECLPIYSGGLGLLAGDHLKSASCLKGGGLPLVAVGLLYRCGYFHQALDDDGLQHELYPDIGRETQPVRRVIDAQQGGQQRVQVELPGRTVHAALWRAGVGRIALYLLDTDLPENDPADRDITRNLYLGDHDMRIRQEMVLGIGGVRALEAVGEHATVFHMNEGHAAFLALERTRLARLRAAEAGGAALSFDQTREATAAAHIFTTHTPVPAGIDRFDPRLVAHYFAGYHDSLGLDLEGFLALGRENVADRSEAFSMAVLALRMSRFANGVSRLHGRVSRGMWRNIWPDTPEDDVPIGHVTNGVFALGWVAPRMAALYDQTLGPAWRQAPGEPASWARIAEGELGGLPDGALWEARQACRRELVQWCRQGIASGRAGGSGGGSGKVLDPGVLTIGFARRFAAYKRGTLLFRDPERLLALLRSPTPVQLVFAGKAHPGDSGGKRLIREIIHFARTHGVQDRLVFLEDYDIEIARRLVQGCDVWLNTPIRGLEASGTSGMKAAANGVIHVSTLDGWWDEGYAPDPPHLGFHIESIGTFDHDLPNDQREQFEAAALYRLLEHEIVPEFYDRGADGLPVRWLARVRRCIAELAPRFSADSMLLNYARQFYLPAHHAGTRMRARDLADAREVAGAIDRYRRNWRTGRVRVIDVQCEPVGGACNRVAAVVGLADLAPEDVLVQLRYGQLDAHGELTQAQILAMAHDKDLSGGVHRYAATFAPGASPRTAWVVRILPGDRRLVTPFIPALIANGPLARAAGHPSGQGGGQASNG
jgi:starch phosphorylase